MANDDVRATLARMEAEETAAKQKAEMLVTENAKKREELLAQLRTDDLADVIAKCKMHGFTATDLRTALKTKGSAQRNTPRKSTPRKSTVARKKRAG